MCQNIYYIFVLEIQMNDWIYFINNFLTNIKFELNTKYYPFVQLNFYMKILNILR